MVPNKLLYVMHFLIIQNLAAHLAVDSNVEFLTNLGFDDLKREMGEGIVGLHTMWNEHFGIGEWS